MKQSQFVVLACLGKSLCSGLILLSGDIRMTVLWAMDICKKYRSKTSKRRSQIYSQVRFVPLWKLLSYIDLNLLRPTCRFSELAARAQCYIVRITSQVLNTPLPSLSWLIWQAWLMTVILPENHTLHLRVYLSLRNLSGFYSTMEGGATSSDQVK